jgi:hypothetical protein
MLSSLETLSLEYESPESRPDWESRSPPPPKRSILPGALERFRFRGVTKYLEDLVTRIDAPQLNTLQITLFNQIGFDTQRLAQFINHTPKLGKCDEAHVKISDRSVHVLFGTLETSIHSREPDRGVSFVAQACNSSFPSTVEDLYIEHPYLQLFWHDYAIDNTLWLQVLPPIYRCEESLSMQGIWARYHGRPARTRWCQNNRSVAQPAEYFRGKSPALGNFPGKHWAVRCRTTALRSPYHHL